MREWWWWWLPGWHRKWKLEKRREEALSAIGIERSLVEGMAQRPRTAENALDTTFLAAVLQRLTEIESGAGQATSIDHLDDLISFAERQGQLRAYICPVAEIQREATLVTDLLEEWGVLERPLKSFLNRTMRRYRRPGPTHRTPVPPYGRSFKKEILGQNTQTTTRTK
jgi:hypothetical protein